MPPSVHKILLHGSIIIRHTLLPIGEMSEESQESRNRDIRRYREHHTRKIDHQKLNEDLLYRLILSSDPFLSDYFFKSKVKRKPLDAELCELLINVPEAGRDESDLESSDSGEES